MPRIRVRDIELYYEVQGSGPRLLFIGGSGGDLRDKPGVFDGPLIEHFEVLSYDQRGLGQSDVPEGPYSMHDYGEDAAALVAALDFAPCLVMGVSFGGMVAQELVCRYPEFVRRLVLACTSPGGAGGSSYPLHTLKDLSQAECAVLMTEISDTRYDAAWREANPEAAEKLMEMALARMKANGGEESHGPRLQLAARSSHDTYLRLRGVSTPVYICGGSYDGIAPPSNQRALASALSNAKLEFFDGGHMFLLQDSSAFGKIMDYLLER